MVGRPMSKGVCSRTMKFWSARIFVNMTGTFMSFPPAPDLAPLATVKTLLISSELSDNFFTTSGGMTFEVASRSRRAWSAWPWMWTTKTGRNLSLSPLPSTSSSAAMLNFSFPFSMTRLSSFCVCNASLCQSCQNLSPKRGVSKCGHDVVLPGVLSSEVTFFALNFLLFLFFFLVVLLVLVLVFSAKQRLSSHSICMKSELSCLSCFCPGSHSVGLLMKSTRLFRLPERPTSTLISSEISSLSLNSKSGSLLKVSSWLYINVTWPDSFLIEASLGSFLIQQASTLWLDFPHFVHLFSWCVLLEHLFSLWSGL